MLAAKQPAAVTSATRSPVPVLAPNTILEQQHRRLLNAMNEGDIGTIKRMLADDIETTDPMGKTTSGRAAVEVGLAMGMGMIKGNIATDVEGGEVKCEVRTTGTAETCSRYTANMMGMALAMGDRIGWCDGKIRSMKTAMNPGALGS